MRTKKNIKKLVRTILNPAFGHSGALEKVCKQKRCRPFKAAPLLLWNEYISRTVYIS